MLAPALRCPKTACADQTFATVPALTLHLVEVHGRPHGEAFVEATKAAVVSTANGAASRVADLQRDSVSPPPPPPVPLPTPTPTEDAMPCSKCGKGGHNARGCDQKAATGKARASAGKKPAAKPAVPQPAASEVNGNLVDRVRQLRADVERGEAAARELAEIRKLLA